MFIPVVLLGPVLCCGREALLALLCCVRRFLLTVAETAGCRQTRVVAVSHVAAVVRLPSATWLLPSGCRQTHVAAVSHVAAVVRLPAATWLLSSGCRQTHVAAVSHVAAYTARSLYHQSLHLTVVIHWCHRTRTRRQAWLRSDKVDESRA
jgi:hypothetical protein